MTAHTSRRIATVLLAPAAALAAWGAMRLLGVDFVLKDGGTVGPVEVGATALLGALAGWFAVRQLERRSRRARQWWSILGSTALAVSIVGPTWLADGVDGVALIALHVVTAVVVITGLAGTLSGQRGRTLRRFGTMTT